MQTFDEAMESVNQETVSILLANGFSQAWDADIFNYANLFEQADFGARNNVIRNIFEQLETFDFEKVMNSLVSAGVIGEAYGLDEQYLSNIEEDKDILKEALIRAISNTHPDRPYDVTDDQYVAVRNFMFQFNAIYTVNYDLLMYWARNKNDLAPVNHQTDDGFRANQTWQSVGTAQEVFFLHGGLHLYDTGLSIKKHVCDDRGDTIVDKVRNNLENGRFPLFVSEPTHEKKLSKIEHNPYLNKCYESLKRLDGNLFIFGHSMDENDKHIFDQIKASNLSRVFVSLYGDENSEENLRTKANARAYIESPGLVVEFYDAATVPVWV
ncbi:DUF4917 family protein [Agarivorans gilvus]|uniref:DUF4917 domain-containing protein n=1 Tax=Agarivorans gilvus TaxID=680279 RepID=A0ABQ1I5Z1_9ALTE|nr:DUF4917 family protein [Agarivorans gilvus]GGB20039.1 DUF4917 domain-containing protein [Agarivorans gilvus]